MPEEYSNNLSRILEKIESDLDLIKTSLVNIRLDMVNRTDFEKHTANLAKLEMTVASKANLEEVTKLRMDLTQMQTQFKIVWAACGLIATAAGTALLGLFSFL